MKKTLIVALLTTAIAAFATPANAAVTGAQATLMCGGGQVKAMAPAVYTNQNETVFWATQLFTYTNAGWVTVGTYSPFAYAGSVNGRTGQWYWASNNAGLLFRNYDGLSRGYYAVMNFFWTQSGGWKTTISTYGNTYYCNA